MERKESELNLLVGIDGVDAVLQLWFSATTAESFHFYSLCSYLFNLRSDYFCVFGVKFLYSSSFRVLVILVSIFLSNLFIEVFC